MGPSRGTPGRRPRIVLLSAVALAAASVAPAALAKLETWRAEGTSAFSRGKREGLVVTDEGRLVLGRVLKPEGGLAAGRVWDLAATPEGVAYAATGDDGKVYRREPGAGADWTVELDQADSQALALAVNAEGKVVVGTGPGGKVIDLTGPGRPSSKPDPGVLYVWDLAFDPEGNLYAATGPAGQLWKRSAAGDWSLLLDVKANHLLCVVVGPDGSVFTAGDVDGVIYRVGRDGKVSVVYDTPQDEVRALLVLPDGTLYAGTAADSSGGSTTRTNTSSADRTVDALASAGADDQVIRASAPAQSPPAKKEDAGPTPRGLPGSLGGSAAPKSLASGENCVYRIDPSGVAREVFREKVLIHALAHHEGRLFIGTGPDGVLYELSDRDRVSTPVARLDNGHVLSLLVEKGGGVLLGTADPGRVVRLEPAHLSSGTFVSEIRDTKLTSRFGALEWSADEPAGTGVNVEVRSGNVGEPDETWSAWSRKGISGESTTAPDVPPGRFVQYRATLTTADPARTPALRSVSLRYRTANLAPEITKLEVPDLAAMDGESKPPKLSVKFEATDPNDDEVQYLVEIRKKGWPGWVRLTETPVTEKTQSIDNGAFPDGVYQVRLTADDALSNNEADARSAWEISDSFLIDGQAPVVSLEVEGTRVTAKVTDALTRIARAAYSVDGKPWVPVFADDGFFDTKAERIRFTLGGLKSGAHVLVVRASDAAGNLGSADILLNVP